MLNMFEEGICQATYGYAKASNKYMRNYDKTKESSFSTMLILCMDMQCGKSYL